MRQFEMSFDDALILRMATEALKVSLTKKQYGNLDRLHFTKFDCNVGDEVLSQTPQYKVSARIFTKSPLVSEKITKVIIKGHASVFYQSFAVEAECILYRHEIEGAGRSILEPGHITVKYCATRDSDDGFEEFYFYYANGYDATRSYCSILKEDLTAKEKVKLAIIATDILSDQDVEKLVLAFEVTSVEDFDEIIDCLSKHRPSLAKRLLSVDAE